MPRPKAERHRGHNEGSITQRTIKHKDGSEKIRWRARVFVNGERLSCETNTKDEANKWIRKQLADADNGILPVNGGKEKLGAFLKRWMEIVKPSVKPKTWQTYGTSIRLYLTPTIREAKLAQLRPDHLQALYSAKLEVGLSPRTVQIVHAILHRALSDAVKWNLVARNVCDAVTPPRAAKKELKVWAPEEARQFLDSLRDDPLEPLYRIALSCGLRIGEILGLKWEDVDLQGGRLQVRRTLQRGAKGEGVRTVEPKTARGRRQIFLSTTAIEALRRWRVHQMEQRLAMGAKWRDTGHVFTSWVGTALESSTVGNHFKRAIAKSGLPSIRFHDLRHTCATMLLAEGINVKVVSEMLGHSQISMTLDIYSHVLPTMQEQAARAMDRVLA